MNAPAADIAAARGSRDGMKRDYWCFISYRHLDNKQEGRQWATWLHQAIETYEVPEDLVGTVNDRGDTIPERIFPVFRDEEELPADADLASPIFRALDRSRFLVVLCSPRAVASTYVDNEIRYFKQIGKSDRVLAAIIEGEPNSSWDKGKQAVGIGEDQECFPKALRHPVDAMGSLIESDRAEPIAADFRIDGTAEQGWTTPEAYRRALVADGDLPAKTVAERVARYRTQCELGKLKIIAGILGLPLGQLTRRDAAYQLQAARKRARVLRRWLSAVAICAVIAATFGVLALYQQRKTAAANERNLKLLHDASMADYSIAIQRLDRKLWHEGVAHLSRALEWESGNARAASRLYSALTRGTLANAMPPRAVFVHETAVRTASFSPDGSRVITISEDSIARLWDANTGDRVAEPLRHEAVIHSGSFSPDGSRIVTSAADGTARIWDAVTGKSVGAPMRHEGAVSSASFSLCNEYVVTASADKTARIWDSSSGAPLFDPLRHDAPVSKASFGTSPTVVLTVSGDTARLWDTLSAEPVGEVLRHDESIKNARFSPDGRRVVTASADMTARVWDAATGKPIGDALRHGERRTARDAVLEASFSPDGKTVATCSENTAWLWDAEFRRSPPLRHAKSVLSATFSPDSLLVVTTSADNTAQVWDVLTAQPIGDPIRHESLVYSASFSADGRRLLTASADKTVRVWDAVKHVRQADIGYPLRHTSDVTDASYSPDGRVVLTASGRSVHFWDAATGQPARQALEHKESVNSASFSADGRRVVCATAAGATIWDTATGQPLNELENGQYIRQASFSSDARLVLTVGEVARIWDVVTGQPHGAELAHKDSISAASFSPDSRQIVTAGLDRAARIWEAATGKAVGDPLRHEDFVTSAKFSPDGRRIVTGTFDHKVRLWDAATRELQGDPLQLGGQVKSASFSRDGDYILAVSAAARIWDAATRDAVGEPIQHPSKGMTTAAFSPDARHVVTAGGADETALIWQVGGDLYPPASVPDWVPRWAQAIAGRGFNSDGVMQPMPVEERLALLYVGRTGDDAWSKLARWIATPPAQRSIHPDAAVTARTIAERERDFGTKKGLESALWYDPAVPIARLLLAAYEEDPRWAAFLRDYDLGRLPNDPALCVRASLSLSDQKQPAAAIRAAQRALQLDPQLPEAHSALARARAAAKE
jgi:WD40 repeat protein